MRIAYGSNEETKTSNYQVYSEAWLVRINNAIPIEYLDFMAKLRVGGFSLGLPHINTRLNAHLNTDWNGKWALSANHLDGKNPIPKIWQPWEGARLITDALKDTDYPPPPKKAGPRRSYEVTLLWCPDQSNPSPSAPRRNSIISISSLDTLPSLRNILSTRVPPSALTMPETATTPAAIVPKPAPEPAKPAPKQAANGAHKRQISEAIPRNERADAGKTYLENENPPRTGNGGADSRGADTECRRSGRVHKPKQRN